MDLSIGNLPLTGTKLDENVSGFTSDPDSQQQVSPILRAAQPFIKDRGNTTTAVIFNISRTHATAEKAAYFCLDHERRFPVQAMFVYKTDEGVFYLADAVARVTRSTFETCYTTHSYRVVGGVWQPNRPTTVSN